jgi:hypothetical protein
LVQVEIPPGDWNWEAYRTSMREEEKAIMMVEAKKARMV